MFPAALRVRAASVANLGTKVPSSVTFVPEFGSSEFEEGCFRSCLVTCREGSPETFRPSRDQKLLKRLVSAQRPPTLIQQSLGVACRATSAFVTVRAGAAWAGTAVSAAPAIRLAAMTAVVTDRFM